MPHGLVRSYRDRRMFVRFADASGLLYFGRVDARSDEHVPVRGFTMSARVADDHYMNGTIDGRDVTLLQRTDYNGSAKSRPETWVIASVRLVSPSPRVLLMSHAHPRSVYEAAFIGLVRCEHVAVEYRLDGSFLIYAHRTDLDAIRRSLAGPVADAILSHPAFDYEFDSDSLMVYARTSHATYADASALLRQALSLADEYEKDLR